ncbi:MULTISPECIES: S41 family peptidase [Chitinophagaceae]
MKAFFKRAAMWTLTSSLLVTACSKKDVPTTTAPPSTSTLSATDQLLDSIFLYAKQLYLWNTQLPDSASFKPLRFDAGSGTDSAKGYAEMFALTRYAINSATGKSYEYYVTSTGDTTHAKYSFIESHDADLNGGQGTKSNVTLLGWGNDLGFVPATGNKYANVIYPRIVYNNGPANLKNIKRGQLIYKVNGTEVDLTTDAGIDALNAAFDASTITLTFADTYTDGQKWTSSAHTSYYPIVSVTQSHDITLTQARYASNTILKDTTLTVGTNKIGYLALLNFADPSVVATNLTNAFKTFSSNGITDIVVDLRYNGGGMVETSQQMANLIAPSSLNGKTMFVENYNQLMQNGQATMLKNIPQDNNPSQSYFAYTWKASDLTYKFDVSAGAGLTVNNVCFIVSNGTASASELLINNLKPYMNVKLIGTTVTASSSKTPAATNTYGKPVGFFAIPIGKYDVYLSEFESRNSGNTAVPYSGFTCDVTDWDDPTHDLGDIKEDGLAQAVNYITKGGFITTTSTIGGKSVVNSVNSGLQIYMSQSGGGNVQEASFQSFNPTLNIQIQKGMVENFKTINR